MTFDWLSKHNINEEAISKWHLVYLNHNITSQELVCSFGFFVFYGI